VTSQAEREMMMAQAVKEAAQGSEGGGKEDMSYRGNEGGGKEDKSCRGSEGGGGGEAAKMAALARVERGGGMRAARRQEVHGNSHCNQGKGGGGYDAGCDGMLLRSLRPNRKSQRNRGRDHLLDFALRQGNRSEK
jgi:hypothetical protein